ncbi:hypothetical protein F5888DRAFT_370662 [Russula emetica]|nr:hypothetical protein F5888DRAFT_370662 [Russula emetica]
MSVGATPIAYPSWVRDLAYHESVRMIPSFSLCLSRTRLTVLGFLCVCSRVSSAPHFTWPEASIINCTSIDVVRKCVGNSLYTFTAASHGALIYTDYTTWHGSLRLEMVDMIELKEGLQSLTVRLRASPVDRQVWLLLCHTVQSYCGTSVINRVCPNAEAALRVARSSQPRRRFPCVVPLGVTSGASMHFFPNRIYENGRTCSRITHVLYW